MHKKNKLRLPLLHFCSEQRDSRSKTILTAPIIVQLSIGKDNKFLINGFFDYYYFLRNRLQRLTLFEVQKII